MLQDQELLLLPIVTTSPKAMPSGQASTKTMTLATTSREVTAVVAVAAETKEVVTTAMITVEAEEEANGRITEDPTETITVEMTGNMSAKTRALNLIAEITTVTKMATETDRTIPMNASLIMTTTGRLRKWTTSTLCGKSKSQSKKRTRGALSR
jgi:hypothetical protein